MAKRSARKARTQDPQPRRPETTPAPQRRAAGDAPLLRTRPFWIGVLAAAAVLVPLAVAAVLLLPGSDDDGASGRAPTATPAAEEEVERLQDQFAARDRRQIQELTERARGTAEQLEPIVSGMARTLPPASKRIGPLASQGTVRTWLTAARDLEASYADTESGETATNVARNGVANAVGIMREAVETYALALERPEARQALLRRAAAQRDLAARTWSTAGIQLDVVNIQAGYGHQHVTFPSAAGEAAAPPDALPEGTDAHEGE